MKITRRQIGRLIQEALSEKDTMEVWWNKVKKDIDDTYKEDVSSGLSEYSGAKKIDIKYVSTGEADSSGSYSADHEFKISPDGGSSEQESFNEMVLEKLNQHSEEAGDDFWKSMANQYSDFDFEYKPSGVEHSKGRNIDMDNDSINETKLSRRQLRKLISEAIMSESVMDTAIKTSKESDIKQVNYYDPRDKLVQILKNGVIEDTIKNVDRGTKAYKKYAFPSKGIKVFNFDTA
jgi:hypothetical protein